MVANRQAFRSGSGPRRPAASKLSACAGLQDRGCPSVVAVCTTIAVLGTAGSIARAEDAAAPVERPDAQVAAPASTATQPPQQLETVIVTARRRLEKADDTPVVLTTLSADRIERLGVGSMEALGGVTPGLIVTRGHSGSGADFRLRGVGTTFSSIGMEQSVAVIVDGVYYGQHRVIDEGFDDLGRIEILKGPQALFFGKNSTSGVVSIVTEDPGTDFEVKARGGYELKARESKGLFVISGPASDSVGLRLAISGREMAGGYVRNTAPATTYTTVDAATGASTPHAVPAGGRNLPGDRSLSGRLTATYAASDDLKLTLKAMAGTHRSGSQTWNDRLWKCPPDTSTPNPSETCGDGFVVAQNPAPPDIAATRPDLNTSARRSC
jgi:iron complex outermembrane recepter protein